MAQRVHVLARQAISLPQTQPRPLARPNTRRDLLDGYPRAIIELRRYPADHPYPDTPLTQAGYTAYYRSAFDLAQDLAEADATRPELIKKLTRIDLLVIEDLGMRRLPPTAAEDLLEIFTRRYESGAILVSSNRPIEDWGQVLSEPKWS